jgi:FlaA1/EpsC-like NDP-sugar epimerase
MKNTFINTDESTLNLARCPLDITETGASGMRVAELLGRKTVPLHSPVSHMLLKNRVVLVTGAAGSIGSELCRQLLAYEPALLIGLDTNETGLFYLTERLHKHPGGQAFQPRIGDLTDTIGMEHIFANKSPHIVFHVAAYKHVPLLEQHPDQAIRTNVLATYHLCHLAQQYGTAHFVFVSTDKAAEPTNVMGASKRFGELVVRSLADTEENKTSFCAVRFGNVIGSRGSVVPTFVQQINAGGPITITDARATRYFMTTTEACGLVVLTAAVAEPGSIYLLDMGEPVRIEDLAQKMIRAHSPDRDITILYTGLRPGERLHEVLFAANEELSATMYDKILRVTCKEDAPTHATIKSWVALLADCLLTGDEDALRQYLFACVQQRTLVFVG